MVKMICEMEILPINGFPKKNAINGRCKNKNCIKKLHFFCQKSCGHKKSEEKKRKHAWHLNKDRSKGLAPWTTSLWCALVKRQDLHLN